MASTFFLITGFTEHSVSKLGRQGSFFLRQDMKQAQTSSDPVHVLSTGAFGSAILRHLRALRSDVIDTDVVDNLLPLPSTWPSARILALTSWRQVNELCELINEASYSMKVPFIPVIQDLTAIRLGPIIMPDCGPCWHCWMTRSRQHAGWTQERVALSQHYAAHPEQGPQGYLEPVAAMAAVLLSEAVVALDSGVAVPGYIWQIEFLTGEITASALVGVHDCDWCGLKKPRATRSVEDLQKNISYLWSQ